MDTSLFTKDISLGNVITLLAMLFTLYKFHISNVTKINKIENRVEVMWAAFKTRFNMHDDEIEENR